MLSGSVARRGFTLIEMLFVLAMMGILFAITIPRMRVTPGRKVRMAAQQLVRDLEVARTRSLATKKNARIVFDAGSNSYTGYLDDDRDGAFVLTAAESGALGARGTVTLPSDLTYGRGSASALPGESAAGAITLSGSTVEFSARGVTVPFGARGTIYLVHRNDPNAVSAVSITGAGSFQAWTFVGGTWK
ncbi:MAG: type II secretion system protein [Gemmatimonadales bacterium]|jgi:prepilin-type N-terminal cleavage/methylation domain-containing protein